jgi:L-amino acid ligase C-terminal domain 2
MCPPALEPQPLLYVDDRPISLTETLLRRTDVAPILLRFEEAGPLPPLHLRATMHLPAFTVRTSVPLALEARRFAHWCEDQDLTPRHFCNPSEPRQAVSNEFASLLGLPSMPAHAVAWVRDKQAMKRRLGDLGFQVAAHAEVRSPSELREFGEHRGWPIVVKPIDGFACIDTHVIPSREAAINHPLGTDRHWLAERFVDGKEWECCALVFGGEVLDVYVSQFPAPPLLAADGAINANISLGGVPPDFPVDVTAMVQRIVTGMDLRDGYLHMEMFLSAAGHCVVSEVGFRIAGCEIAGNHGLARGFDIFGSLIDIHLGHRPSLDYTLDRCVGDLLLPLPAGEVRRVTPLDDLLALDGVIGGRINVQAGDRPRTRRASHACSGYLQIEGDNAMEVETRMLDALDRFSIETTNLNESRGKVVCVSS